MLPKITVILSAALGLASAPAMAEWRDAAPRPFENGAYLELSASTDRDENRNNGRNTGWSDDFFREKITLFSVGYVYHPRFLQYQLSFGGALKQENYSPAHGAASGWKHGSGAEYEARFSFLPEHPYNFELFALRYEPLYKQQAANQRGSVETSNGAHFRYRRKPYFFHASYLDNTTRAHTSTSNVERVGLNGEYFRRLESGNEFSVTAALNPSRFTGDMGLEGHSTQYGVTGLANVRKVRLYVTATKDAYDQESPLSGRIDNDQFAFEERLSAYLPLNFRTDLFYRHLENESKTPDPTASGRRELSDVSEDLQAIVSHRLYQSLDSRYIFLRNARTSSAGESTAVSHSLGFDYSKSIPRGRVMAGLNLATSQTDNSGRADIVSEPHPAIPVPGSFDLVQQNVERESLAVYLRSPLPPFEMIRLAEPDHYTATLVGNVLKIDVFNLPAPFVVPGTYDLSVSFTLSSGEFELRTNTYGLTASVQLLDNLLTPYVGWIAVRSDVLSGVFPGVPLDSTTRTVGLTARRGAWRAMGEYQSLDWDVSPYRSWRGEVQYTESVNATTRIYATGTYLDRYYPDGSSGNVPEAYSDRSASLSASLQKEFLSRTLMFSAGGSYSRLLGTVDSNAYSLSSSLTWKIGKLDLSAGANVYGSNTQGSGAGRYDQSRQSYYARLRRRLF